MVFKAVCDEEFWEDVDASELAAFSGFTGLNPGARSELAVKVIRPEFARDTRARRYFSREANVMSRLRHPNILPVFSMGALGEIAYFVMPYVESGSLASSMDPDSLMSAQDVHQLALQMARALEDCHRRDVLHRDVKPSNILKAGPDHWLLCDFGLARTSFNDSFIDP